MKNALRLLTLAAAVASFTLPALAQDTPAAGAASVCTAEADAKAALYKKFLDNYKGTPEQQKVANEGGKEYLGKYGTCPDESDKKIATFIQNWVGKYEKAVADFEYNKAVAENPAEAFRLSRDRLAKNPDDALKIYLQLIQAGAKNKGSYGDAANAARKALELVEQGKTTDTWAPLTGQQDAAAGLHYFIAFFTLDSAPDEAATHLLKVAQSSGGYSKEPSTFQLLGLSYYNGEFKKLAAEYQTKFEGKDATPESEALFAKINAVLDRVIDAYARSIALGNTNPSKYADIINKVKPGLTALYKQRHENSDTGLQELIAGVLSKPLPIPGQEPVTPAAPAASSGTTGTNGATPAGQPVSSATPPASAAGTPPKPAAQPASTTATPASATPKPTPKPIK
jgi:hypothetical protein